MSESPPTAPEEKPAARTAARGFVRDRGLILLILLLPFLMFHWMIPFFGHRTIGNDYLRFGIESQLELMLSLETGSFPLYVPGFCGGQPAGALMMGQIHHPLPHLSRLMPGYWAGGALDWNTLFRLITLAGAQMALFLLFRSLRLGGGIAFLLSMAAVYNLRMLDMFRYGASFETWTGYLAACSALGWAWLRRHAGSLLPAAAAVAAVYWILTSGHPQMIYYGLMGLGAFVVVFPFFAAQLLGSGSPDGRELVRYWTGCALASAAGGLLAAWCLAPLYLEVVRENANRLGQDYAWAVHFDDTLLGTVSSFLHPPWADVHGGFGGTALFLAAALAPVAALRRRAICWPVAFLWLQALFVFLHMQGERTFVHYLIWKYLPFASGLRTTGRIAMLMPLPLVMILAWLLRRPQAAESRPVRFGGGATVVGATALVVLVGGGVLLWDSGLPTTHYCPASIREMGPVAHLSLFALAAGSLAALIFLSAARTDRLRRVATGALALLVGTQIAVTLRYGTWTAPPPKTPTLETMLSQKRAKLGFRPMAHDMYSRTVWEHVLEFPLEPFLGKVYRQSVHAGSRGAAYALMRQGRRPDQAILACPAPAPARPEAPADGPAAGTARLTYSSFNRVVFRVHCSADTVFGAAFPWAPGWRASVNGRPVGICPVNGAAIGVRVPAGTSVVAFRFWSPSAFAGLLVSVGTLIGLAVFTARAHGGGPLRLLVAGGVALSAAAGAAAWYNSLYTGRNLGTSYAWRMPESGAPVNMAYGRRAWMSSMWGEGHYPDMYGAGKALDGSRETGRRPALTLPEIAPWWVVDLGRATPMGCVVLHLPKGYVQHRTNGRPLTVSISNDGRRWRELGVLEAHAAQPYRWIITCGPEVQARFIRVKAVGPCVLAIDEFEVFAPSGTGCGESVDWGDAGPRQVFYSGK